jgi:hypothetical protein
MAGAPQLSGFQHFSLGYYLDASALTYFIAGSIIVFIPYHRLQTWGMKIQPPVLALARGVTSLMIVGLAVLLLSKTQFNPFIYFQF